MNGKLRVSPSAPASVGSGSEPTRDWPVKVVREISLALAVYGMAGWIYVAICALVAPETLALPLTHLLPHLREDTSGALSFIVSFLGFISYRMTRRNEPKLRLFNLAGQAPMSYMRYSSLVLLLCRRGR